MNCLLKPKALPKSNAQLSSSLSVAAQRQGVATLPVATARTTNGLVEQVTLTNTTGLATSRSETTELAVLHSRLADPVHARIATDSLVERINTNDFVELEGSILVNPVAVQDAQVGEATTNALLSNSLQVTGRLELVNSLRGGLGHDLTLADLAFATTAADTDAVDDDTLLGLVAKTASLVGAGRTRGTVDDLELTILPAADTEQKAQDIRLLLLVQFFQVLVGTHYIVYKKRSMLEMVLRTVGMDGWMRTGKEWLWRQCLTDSVRPRSTSFPGFN